MKRAPPTPIDRERARSLALSRVSRREVSPDQLRDYLVSRGAQESDAESIVADFVQNQLVSADRYAQAALRSYARAKRGPRWIAQKLKAAGVKTSERELIATYAETVTDCPSPLAGPGPAASWEAETLAWVERRYPGIAEDPAALRRARDALLRRGFPFDWVTRILNTLRGRKTTELD